MNAIYENFFSRFAGAMFNPSQAAASLAENHESGPRLRGSLLYVFYIWLVTGVSMWFLVFYPEPLYFHTSPQLFLKTVPANLAANPMMSLLLVLAGSFLFIVLQMYLAPALVSHALLKRASGSQLPLGRYLALYAWSLTPLLFWAPLIALRVSFFEKWLSMKPLYPFIDMTLPNIAQLMVTAFFILWKYRIEARMNLALFKVNRAWPAALVAGQILVQAGLLLAPYLFNHALFESMKGSLT